MTRVDSIDYAGSIQTTQLRGLAKEIKAHFAVIAVETKKVFQNNLDGKNCCSHPIKIRLVVRHTHG